MRKVVACLIRPGLDGVELLVFRHPNGTIQIPKGTLEKGESPEVAVLRELEEESGISAATLGLRVDLDRVAPRGPAGAAPSEDQVWHVFTLRPAAEVPDSWQHRARGSPEEEGLVFSCRWLRLSGAKEELDELYHPVVDMLMDGK